MTKRELDACQLAERSISKKYRKEIWNPFIAAVKRYELVEPGDKIAVCVSGGKDSMLLAKLMQMLQRYTETPFDLVFLMMDPGYAPENRKLIEENAALLRIPLHIFETDVFQVANGTEKNPCYLCARMRRGHLYSEAQKLGCNKIALGHHFSDVIETTVMGMFYGAQLQAMLPKLHSDNYPGMSLIRPLYCVHEDDILAWQRYNQLHFIQCACRFTERETGDEHAGKRREIKELIRQLKRQHPDIEKSIFASLHNLCLDTFPGYKHEGEEHSFLERYNEIEKKEAISMLRIAMLSKWHVHAEGYAQFIQDQPDAEITCVWDEDSARGKAWGEKLSVPFIPDLDALLARPDVDAVIIDSPTSMHKELMVKAAKAGKHIFTEKCMCLTVADCDEVIRAVEDAGVIFTISFPQRARGRSLFVKKCVEEGTLGDVTMLRTRTSHNGATAGWLPDYWFDPETTGGGAMMDLGAHPMYLARWILGKPVRISSLFNTRTGYAVEDNAVCAIEFENKAIAVAETSLISGLNPEMLEVYGTKGVLLCADDTVRMRTLESKDWMEITPPAGEALPLRQFLDSVLYGKPVQYGLQEGRELTELMEAAYRSHREHREITF